MSSDRVRQGGRGASRNGSSARQVLPRLVVSVGLLLILGWLLDPGQVIGRLTDLSALWILVALGVSVFQMAVLAWRWRYTAGRMGIDLSWVHALREYYLATFLNQVLPGGVLGDVSRAWRHGRVGLDDGATGGTAIRAVIFERASAQVIMTGAALVSLLILPVEVGPSRWTVVGVVGAVATGAALVLVVRRRRSERGDDGLIGRSWTDTRRALLTGRAFAVQLGTGLVVVSTYIATYVLAARALGIGTPLGVLLPLIAPVLSAMLIPVTIAGWGVREGAAALLWGVAGLTAVDGVAISVAYGLIVLLSALPGALVLVWVVRPTAAAARIRDVR